MKLKKYLDFFKRKPKSNIPKPMQILFDCIDKMELKNSPNQHLYTYMQVIYNYDKSNSEEAKMMSTTKDHVTLTEEEFIETLESGDIKFKEAFLLTNSLIKNLGHVDLLLLNESQRAIGRLITNWINKSPIENTHRFIVMLESNGIYFSDIEYKTVPKLSTGGSQLRGPSGPYGEKVTYTTGMALEIKNLNKEFLKAVVKITYPHSKVSFDGKFFQL